MKCPNCGAATTLASTEERPREYTTWRRYRCQQGCRPFLTAEVLSAAYGTLKRRGNAAAEAAKRRAERFQRNERIRKAYQEGSSLREIGERFSLSPHTISGIVWSKR